MSKMKSISNHNDGGIWFFMYSLVLVVAYAGLITYSAPPPKKNESNIPVSRTQRTVQMILVVQAYFYACQVTTAILTTSEV